MSTADREQLAENGADVIAMIDRELESEHLPDAWRKVFTAYRDHLINVTAAYIAAQRNAEHYDAVLFGDRPAVLVHALRQHLSPGQAAQLAAMLDPDRP